MILSIFLIIVVSATISIPINCVPVSESARNLTICITNGCIQGKEMSSDGSEGSYDAFVGIPYAKPPVGHLRFSNPESPENWTNTLDATMYKPDCLQKNVLLPNPTVMGSEDCLYLNVYRPILRRNNNENKLLPVMIFIHGGGFFAGSASPSMVGPQHFMENGEVILVAMAYRLGVFGFLSTEDEHSPGNFGLKDQALALRWVKNNIRAFGGDNTQTTIFGVSAGAASVHMHMMSPLSQGLFQRAIVMSGSAIAPYNDPVKNSSIQATKQATVVGIDGIQGMNNRKLVEKLREVTAEKLVDSIDKLKMWSVDPLTFYRTVIEQNRTGAFMVEDPKDTWKGGHFKHIPFMTGTVQHEGAVRAAAIVTNPVLLDDINKKLRDLVPKLMELEFESKSKSKQDELYEKLKNRYLNGSDSINKANMQGFIDMFSDRAFNHPYYHTVSNYLKYAEPNLNPVSLYRFTFKGPYSYSLAYTGTTKDFGVVHLDDTLYLLGSLFPPFSKSVYSNLTKTLVDFYVSFAKNGRPIKLSQDTVHECTKFHQGPFCDYQEFRNTADGGFEVRTGNSFDLEMVKFWDDILK